MDRESLDRARARLAETSAGRPEPAALEAALARAGEALDDLASRASELEATVPDRVGEAVQQGLRAQVLPVGRHIAEVRGLSGQTIRRLERLQRDLDSERRARVEDLALLVDLIASAWHGVERRLDRMERIIDRLERSLDERPGAALYRIDERHERRSS
jgi:hypothetical protein